LKHSVGGGPFFLAGRRFAFQERVASMAVRRLYRPEEGEDDLSLVVKLERLLDANRRLMADFERHRDSENAWRAERALFMAVLDRASDRLLAKDPDGRILVANAAAARDLGFYEAEDLVGLTDADVYLDPEVARAVREDDLSVLESGRAALDVETTVATARGETRRVSTSRYPLIDERGDVIGLVCAVRDLPPGQRSDDQPD
jgi:PAS domain S-box-containing protein